MRILAPFAIVCVALVGLVLWQLGLAHREPAVAPQPPSERNVGPLPISTSTPGRGDETDAKPGARAAAPPRQAHGSDNDLRPETAIAAIPVSGDESQAKPRSATRPAVHWAGDVRRRHVKERFIELRELLANDPYNEAALGAALEAARALEWHNEVCDLLGRLVRLRDDDTALRFELATSLMRLKRWLEAIPQLRLVVGRQPDNAHAWYNLAIAHQSLAHLHDARATWNHVITLMPDNPDAYAHRGEVLLDLKAWSAAAADFETALQLNPGAIDVALNLSLARYKLGRLSEARDALRPILKEQPQHVPVLNRLAEIAWGLYQADPEAGHTFARETVDYCLRSLGRDADQPEIRALLERAQQADD